MTKTVQIPACEGQIRVRRAGRFTIIEPAVSALERLLRMRGVVMEAAKTGAVVRRTKVSLLRRESTSNASRLVGPAAVEPLILQALDAQNIPYRLTGQRPEVLTVAPVEGIVDHPLIERAARTERLVVQHGAGVDPARIVVDLCRAFPNLRVGVLAKRWDDVRRVTHYLNRAGVPASAYRADSPLDHGGGRVAVTTFQAAGHGRAGLWSVDLLIVLNMKDTLGEHGREAVELAHRDHPDAPRLVAFTPQDFTPSVNQKAEILTTFGPYKVGVPMHGLIGRPVEHASFHVYSVTPGNTFDTISSDMINGNTFDTISSDMNNSNTFDTISGNTISSDMNNSDMINGNTFDTISSDMNNSDMNNSDNTNKIAMNNSDNLSKSSSAVLTPRMPNAAAMADLAKDPVLLRRGAALASALAAGDAAGVARICPRLDGHPRLGRPASVLVVAGGPGPARWLLRELPGWTPIGPDLRGLLVARPWWGGLADRPVPSICTARWLQFADVGRFDFVVRLDGSGAVPSPVANDGNDAEPLLFIDVAAPGRPEIERLFSARRAAYEERGWLPFGNRYGPELLKFIRTHHASPRARRKVEKLLKPRNVAIPANRS